MASATRLLDSAHDVDGARVVAGQVSGADRDALKVLALDLRNRIGTGIVVLGTPTPDGKALLITVLTNDLVERGITARDVLQPGAQLVGGGAGGKGDVAQAGGKDGTRIAEALEAARHEAVARLHAGG